MISPAQGAASLLHIDLRRASEADRLRVDLHVVLRRIIDDAAEAIFAGERIDGGKIVAAAEQLIGMLPQKKLPQPVDDDPLDVMLAELAEMKRRGEIAVEVRRPSIDQPLLYRSEADLHARISELEAENARLRGLPEIDRLQAEVDQLERKVAAARADDAGTGARADDAGEAPRELTEAEVIPPGEIADNDHRHVRQRGGPFDAWEPGQWHE